MRHTQVTHNKYIPGLFEIKELKADFPCGFGKTLIAIKKKKKKKKTGTYTPVLTTYTQHTHTVTHTSVTEKQISEHIQAASQKRHERMRGGKLTVFLQNPL